MTLEVLHYGEIWSNIGKVTLERNFDVTIGRAACEKSSAIWNLGTNSVFAPRPRKITGNLDRVGRSQDFQAANWRLASSPTLNTRNLTLIPIWLQLYLKNVYLYKSSFLCAYFRWALNICEENTCQRVYAHTGMQTCMYLYLWLFEYSWIWISILVGGSDIIWGLLPI
jgi:hypothetical protein